MKYKLKILKNEIKFIDLIDIDDNDLSNMLCSNYGYKNILENAEKLRMQRL